MAGYKGWMKEMLAVKAEIAADEAEKLKKLAMAKAANAAGFKARAAAAKAALNEAVAA